MLDLLIGVSDLVEKLTVNTRHFRQGMEEAGFKLKGKDHPIVPVMSEDARLATEFADNMLEKGIYVIGFTFPVVPKGEQDAVLARILVLISFLHSLHNYSMLQFSKRKDQIL